MTRPRDFKELLEAKFRNAWIVEMGVTAYLRITRRYLGGQVVDTIDVANVKVETPFKKGRGVFTAFLEHMEEEGVRLNRVVYVENVLEERFRQFFRRRGYTEVPTVPPSFWKPLPCQSQGS